VSSPLTTTTFGSTDYRRIGGTCENIGGGRKKKKNETIPSVAKKKTNERRGRRRLSGFSGLKKITNHPLHGGPGVDN